MRNPAILVNFNTTDPGSQERRGDCLPHSRRLPYAEATDKPLRGPEQPQNVDQPILNEFLQVLGIGLIAASITYVGAPLAERFDVPGRVVNAALQFAAGVLIGAIALSLLVSAVQGISSFTVVMAFLAGGSLFIALQYVSSRLPADPASGSDAVAFGLYVGILGEMLIDGMIIGIGAANSLATGMQLALGIAVSQTPLAFVATATARKQGMAPETRRWLAVMYFACMLAGTVLGYLLLRNQSEEIRLTMIAAGAGFLLTVVTQVMIPEAIERGRPNLAGIFFVIGLTLYGLLTIVS